MNAKKGLTFASGLRSFLRQDPDVMMVGEIRDLETAEVAIRAALTGHLVFSTVHTNDAASTVTRMVDQGVEPYLVASSIVLMVAQRLVRTICPHCKHARPDQRRVAAKLKKVGLKARGPILGGEIAYGDGLRRVLPLGLRRPDRDLRVHARRRDAADAGHGGRHGDRR